jgi:predicted permease
MGLGTGFARLLLFALMGWTALGAIGVTISLRRGERRQAGRNLIWIVAIWLVYLSTLLTVSVMAKPFPATWRDGESASCGSTFASPIIPASGVRETLT